MQDFCFKTVNKPMLLSSLERIGLMVDGQICGDFVYLGRILHKAASYDKDGKMISPPAYLEDEYALYRGTDVQAATLVAATFPAGVSLVAPPAGIPLFGGEWLVPNPASARIAAVARINDTADALCSAHCILGATQQKRYDLKLAQAKAYLQDGNPQPENYRMLYNEVGITADTAVDVAMAIMCAAEKCDMFLMQIEFVRLKAKKEIEAATDVMQIATIEASVSWPA